MNAQATAKHRPVLEAIKSGKMKVFAKGGLVSAPKFSARSIAATGSLSLTVAPVTNFTVKRDRRHIIQFRGRS